MSRLTEDQLAELEARPAFCHAAMEPALVTITEVERDQLVNGYRRWVAAEFEGGATLVDELTARAQSAEADLAEAVEVMRPFASAIDARNTDPLVLRCTDFIEFEDFQRARAFVEKHGRKE